MPTLHAHMHVTDSSRPLTFLFRTVQLFFFDTFSCLYSFFYLFFRCTIQQPSWSMNFPELKRWGKKTLSLLSWISFFFVYLSLQSFPLCPSFNSSRQSPIFCKLLPLFPPICILSWQSPVTMSHIYVWHKQSLSFCMWTCFLLTHLCFPVCPVSTCLPVLSESVSLSLSPGCLQPDRKTPSLHDSWHVAMSLG